MLRGIRHPHRLISGGGAVTELALPLVFSLTTRSPKVPSIHIVVEQRRRCSRLYERFRGALRNRDGENFIECDRFKGYRLSTHPAFVTLD